MAKNIIKMGSNSTLKKNIWILMKSFEVELLPLFIAFLTLFSTQNIFLENYTFNFFDIAYQWFIYILKIISKNKK